VLLTLALLPPLLLALLPTGAAAAALTMEPLTGYDPQALCNDGSPAGKPSRAAAASHNFLVNCLNSHQTSRPLSFPFFFLDCLCPSFCGAFFCRIDPKISPANREFLHT